MHIAVSPRAAAAVAASAAVLIAAGALELSQRPAQAGTSQCQNTPQPVNDPVGCGSLFLPGVYYKGGSGYALTATVPGQVFNAPVDVTPMSGDSGQDWTFYQVCTSFDDARSNAEPCGSGRAESGRYVIMATPYGQQPAGGINSGQSLCLDDSGGRAVLGFCDSGGAWFSAGFPDPPETNGAPPVVEYPNLAETWQVVRDQRGAQFVNVRSGGALDDSRSGGPGTRLIVYPRNGGANQVWQVAGCTAPVTGMGHADYGCLGG